MTLSVLRKLRILAPALAVFLTLVLAPAAQATIVIQGSPEFVAQVEACLEKIASSGGSPAKNMSQLTSSNNIHTIKETSGGHGCSPNSRSDATDGTGTGSTTNANPNGPFGTTGGVKGDLCVVLAHELDHATHNDSGDNDFTSTGANGIPTAEIEACRVENEYRAANGLPKRTHYGGKPLP
jgi:Effector protein